MEASPPRQPFNPDTGEQDKPDQPGPKTAEQQGVASHATNPHERIDGLRAWLAQVDRKLGVRTYAFAAATVLALAAAAVAIVFALQLQEDSATKSDLDDLRGDLGAVEQQASEAATDEVDALSDRLDALEGEVDALRGDQRTTSEELQVVQDDIEDLRTEISDIESSPSGGTGSSSGSGGTGP